ncbi:hypothetical protein E2C01_058973 [Portunus trituberculatus]|uniref:Uncharacterized protein n=1 Tax=Portunus trituberculatus TaxID=210409 RepID=A0A5B7GWY6_PORTR|nr:hypothetical protein [Portunus trituberculatus]
MSRLASHPV